MGSWFRMVVCALLLASCASAAIADGVAGRLNADLANGTLSDDDAVLYAAMAIMEPRLLPKRYQGRFDDDCGMELLAILYEKLPHASDETKEAVRYVMTPHERETMERPRRNPESLAPPAVWLTHPTVHFLIHYTTSGTDQTSLGNATDFGNFLEDAYGEYQRHAFTMPAAPADGKIDVVIKANPCVADIGIDCSTGGMAIPPAVAGLYGGQSGDPLILLRSTSGGDFRKTLAAHELFHHVQYQAAGFLPVFAAQFVLEGQASAMEDVVHPMLTFYYSDVSDYYGSLQRSLTARQYDAVVFWKYLIAKHSTPIIRDLLTTLAGTSGVQALNSTLGAYGMTSAAAMHEFALWTFFAGPQRYRAGYFDSDAQNWPSLSAFEGQHELGDDVTKVASTTKPISGLSTRYVRVTPHSSVTDDRTLTIKASGGGVEGWMVHRRNDGTVDVEDMSLSGGEYEKEIDDFNFADTSEVVLIFGNGDNADHSFTYELKLPLVLDLAFCMDTTGSMSSSIAAVRQTAASARDLLEAAEADFRIAITEFKDFDVWPYGWSGDFPYRADSAFSEDAATIDGGIAMLQAWGGGDWPESQLSGVMGAINADGIDTWRSGAKKAIVVMTDAPPHDPEPFTGYTRASVAAAAQAGGIVRYPFRGAATHSVTPETPIAIYGVVVGSDFQAYSALSALANATGGKVWVTSYNTGNIARTILEAIGEISGAEPPPPTGNRPPNASAAIADPSHLWPPNNKLVPVRVTNVIDPDGDAVSIKVTSVTHDETGDGDGDADFDGVGSATARVRAERNGDGNGRLYTIHFTATDARGASSSGKVTVCVPHDQGGNTMCGS